MSALLRGWLEEVERGRFGGAGSIAPHTSSVRAMFDEGRGRRHTPFFRTSVRSSTSARRT